MNIKWKWKVLFSPEKLNSTKKNKIGKSESTFSVRIDEWIFLPIEIKPSQIESFNGHS